MNNLLFKTILLKGEDGSSIKSIEKTNTVGLVDTYTITLDNGDTTTFDVTNGASIESIELTSSDNYVDTYTVNLTDGTTTSFNVTNGQAYTIPKDSVVYYEGNDTPEGYVDTNPPSGSGDFAQIDDTAPSSSKVYSSGKINTDYPFKFGIDDNGNYGYYKAGADTVTPFKTSDGGSVTLINSVANSKNIETSYFYIDSYSSFAWLMLKDIKEKELYVTWRHGTTFGHIEPLINITGEYEVLRSETNKVMGQANQSLFIRIHSANVGDKIKLPDYYNIVNSICVPVGTEVTVEDTTLYTA